MTELRHVIGKARRAALRAMGRDPLRLPHEGAPARRWYRVVNHGRRHRCPICRSRLRAFVPFGSPRRPRAKCPVCGSMEWHRLGWVQAEQVLATLAAPLRALQVAPEREIRRRLVSTPGLSYASVDLAPGKADVVASIQQLPFPPGTFDLIYCSHVLEHVDDDLGAMRELRRVTSDRGVALLLVPITAERTWGDPSITDEAERTRLFGQHDHVRVFGPDVSQRLHDSGWAVEVVRVEDFGGAADELGLPSLPISRAAGDVFVCRPR